MSRARPLIFSTGYAHDLTIVIPSNPAKKRVPVTADPKLGGRCSTKALADNNSIARPTGIFTHVGVKPLTSSFHLRPPNLKPGL